VEDPTDESNGWHEIWAFLQASKSTELQAILEGMGHQEYVEAETGMSK